MRKACFILVAACLTGSFAGCHPKPSTLGPGDIASNGTSLESNSKMKQDSVNEAQDGVGKETCLGPLVAKGVLWHSKGDLGNVGEYILPVHFLEGPSRRGWLPEYEALVGKQVEVKGVHYQYRCGPIEQCIEGGIINWLRDIEYLRAAK